MAVKDQMLKPRKPTIQGVRRVRFLERFYSNHREQGTKCQRRRRKKRASKEEGRCLDKVPITSAFNALHQFN